MYQRGHIDARQKGVLKDLILSSRGDVPGLDTAVDRYFNSGDLSGVSSLLQEAERRKVKVETVHTVAAGNRNKKPRPNATA